MVRKQFIHWFSGHAFVGYITHFTFLTTVYGYVLVPVSLCVSYIQVNFDSKTGRFGFIVFKVLRS